jgi:eukaryotic-like serine/threonine-protein kinase
MSDGDKGKGGGDNPTSGQQGGSQAGAGKGAGASRGHPPPPSGPPASHTPRADVRHDSPTIPSAGEDSFIERMIAPAEELDSFGPYKVLKKLGEGGFGVVYACDQREPIRRQVALKVIKLGMDTREVIARFEAERHALALMDHPNVAKVLDAGVTPRGRPYFVMEYVAGMPITEYCDTAQLTMRDRLQLFMQVCQAVQHAHQKGIIHRDLKPSNVLVTLMDAKPVPKVIDFGIAKAMGQNLTERTMFTEAGRLIGTPEYMSPEQAGLSPLDVDTRTDVYALGVLLYELLTGVLPHEPKKLRRAAMTEIQRIIREEEPPKPSTRLGHLGAVTSEEAPKGKEGAGEGATVMQIAHRRRMEPGQLVRELRGDLDWITMKAMEKDRGRRYDTAAAFAADVEHYLRNEPVTAGPPSATYRMRKFARRNRAGVAVGAVFVLMVVGGVTALSAAYGQAEEQRRIAVHASGVADTERREAVEARGRADREKAAAVEAKIKAEEERARADSERDRADREKTTAIEEKTRADAEAKKVLAAFEFMKGMFESIDPAKARGKEVTVREILDAADEKMKSTKDAPPELEATMREFFSTTFHVLAEYDRAESNMRRALAIRERENGPESAEVLQDLHNLGATMSSRAKFQEARQLLTRAADGRRKLFGEKNRDTLASTSMLVYVTQNLGDLDGAEKLVREVIAAQTELLGPGDRDTIDSRLSLSDILNQLGKYEEAEPYSKDLVETAAKSLGADDPLTLQAMSIRGSILSDMGRFDEAEKVLRATLEMKLRVMGETHNEVMTTRNSYALVLEMLRREPEAEQQFRLVLDNATKMFGIEHPQTVTAMNNLGQLLRRGKKYDDAEKLMRQSLEINRRVTGEMSVETATAEVNLAVILRETDRHQEALLQLEHARVALEKTVGATHWKTLVTRAYIGEEMVALGRDADAEKELTESYTAMCTALGTTHDRTRQVAGVVADLYRKQGKDADEAAWRKKAKAPPPAAKD